MGESACTTNPSNYGQPCSPDNDGNKCSTWTCDGLCPGLCDYSHPCPGSQSCVDNCCVANGGGSPPPSGGAPCQGGSPCQNDCGEDFCCCEPGTYEAPECRGYEGGGYCDDDGDDDGEGCCSQDLEDIVIAINGGGYSLTSPSDGVPFDMTGSGKKIRVAWTAAGSDTAFLALDRNGSGRIDDGTELFGNFTPQPAAPGKKNGFNALAVYDLPANGGNGDGWIDFHDAIYPKLLLWIDKNHNGISEPDELFTLPQLGIARISLSHQEDKWKDAHGNVFRRRAQVVTARSLLGKENWASDVMLRVAK